MDEIFGGLEPWKVSEGTLNYLSGRDIEPDSVRDVFGNDVYDRLQMIKRTYDPENLFRVNHNIPPAQ